MALHFSRGIIRDNRFFYLYGSMESEDRDAALSRGLFDHSFGYREIGALS
ncbi:hypothetical protein Vi05172_g9289 [Venturia inaequalis]|nr:hypothetical protein Vi05172_g9289 [Venturia inaequalis]